MDLPDAIVINLPRRPDRLASIRSRWAQLHTSRALRVHPAVDGQTGLPPDAHQAVRRQPGIYGCWASHRQVLAAADGPPLVLEDDAVFAPHFLAAVEAIEPPADWDLIYLGGQHVRPPQPHPSGLTIPTPRFQRTHAYIARRPKAIAALMNYPHHVDWVFGRMPIRRYAVTPAIVGQDGSPSDVTGTVLSQTFWNRQT